MHLVEGQKWYDVRLKMTRTPTREDDPRHMPPNFYYDQEDLLRERQAHRGWTWSASRPHFIYDFSPERPRNIVSTIGAWAAMCAEHRIPLDFPGSPACFSALMEITDATLLARAMRLDGDEREGAEPGLQRDRQLPVPLAVAVAADRGALRPSRRRGSPPQARRVDEGQGARLAADRRAARSRSQPAPRHRLVGVRGFLLGARPRQLHRYHQDPPPRFSRRGRYRTADPRLPPALPRSTPADPRDSAAARARAGF